MSLVEFIDGDPPRKKASGPPARWPTRLSPLMERPGVWAIVTESSSRVSASCTANQLKSGRLKVPPGSWEFVSRTVEGRFLVYARYLGEDR